MSIDKEFTKLVSEFGMKELEFENLEAEMWVRLTEMSPEDIAQLSWANQTWREYFINERRDRPLFQQLTKMKDPNYEQPPLIKDGFFHPDIAAQLSSQVPVLVRNCPICKEQIRVQLTESQWASSRGPVAHSEIVDEHMASHILEHHPDTEEAERLRSKKTKK